MLLAHHFTAVDDRGTRYQFSASLGPVHGEWSGVLDLHPNPPSEIRWLDLSTTPGEPPTRIDLNSQQATALMVVDRTQNTWRRRGRMRLCQVI